MREKDWSRRRFLEASAASVLMASVRRDVPALPAFDGAADAALRARLAADPLRPQFHLLPAKNWMNDPNGPIFWRGKYHMFFQYNPNAAVWGDMHWNHAISDDMVHWKHLPIALAPTPGWDDADGCFTGSAVDDHGTATIVYTGVKSVAPERATLRDGHANFREVQCLATSADPLLRNWVKRKTPVIEPPVDSPITGFRDPFLWREGETWYLGVASGLGRVGGNVLLYRSKDLRQWEYLHPLAQGKWREKENTNPVDSGEMWECPDFFALGKKHVLLYSTAGGVWWETGELNPKELVFHSERQGILDHDAYYAQKTQLDAHGNRILWGWITEKRPDAELRAAGWAGCMALPRVLSLSNDGELEMRFAPEVQSLRGKKSDLHVMDRNPYLSKPQVMDNIQIENLAAEAIWRISPDLSGSGQLAPTDFSLDDRSGGWFSLRLERPNNATPRLTVNGKSIDVPIGQKGGYEFHLFIDGSVAELICNNLYAVTTRIYRKPDGPLRLTANLDGLQVWQLHPISPNRLTA